MIQDFICEAIIMPILLTDIEFVVVTKLAVELVPRTFSSNIK
jgi:hypothetical protein